MAVAHKLAERARTNDVLISETVDFGSLLLSKAVLNGLKNAGFERPSPIQLKAIPLGRCGLDLIVQAKSGTGKTCVFSVVALEMVEPSAQSTQVLVLAPTREIALQIWEVMRSLGSAMPALKCHTFIGGMPVHEDKKKVQLCHIAVGTPGRIQSLIEQGLLKTESIRLFVLDEADKLLEEGFQPQINWIYSALPDNKQMLALSATYPEYLASHVTLYMRNPTFVRLNISDPTLLGIKQYYITVPSHPLPHRQFEAKTAVVVHLLSSVTFNQCLIFSNWQTRAQNLQSELSAQGWPTTCIAGCLDQKQRINAITQLKTYSCRVLISTDLTSRGIDADQVNLVINLDLPMDHETYLHRIGRAGRFGSYGAGVTIISDGQEMIDLHKIEHSVGTRLLPIPDPIPTDLVQRQLTVNLDDVVSTEQILTTPQHGYLQDLQEPPPPPPSQQQDDVVSTEQILTTPQHGYLQDLQESTSSQHHNTENQQAERQENNIVINSQLGDNSHGSSSVTLQRDCTVHYHAFTDMLDNSHHTVPPEHSAQHTDRQVDQLTAGDGHHTVPPEHSAQHTDRQVDQPTAGDGHMESSGRVSHVSPNKPSGDKAEFNGHQQVGHVSPNKPSGDKAEFNGHQQVGHVFSVLPQSTVSCEDAEKEEGSKEEDKEDEASEDRTGKGKGLQRCSDEGASCEDLNPHELRTTEVVPCTNKPEDRENILLNLAHPETSKTLDQKNVGLEETSTQLVGKDGDCKWSDDNAGMAEHCMEKLQDIPTVCTEETDSLNDDQCSADTQSETQAVCSDSEKTGSSSFQPQLSEEKSVAEDSRDSPPSSSHLQYAQSNKVEKQSGDLTDSFPSDPCPKEASSSSAEDQGNSSENSGTSATVSSDATPCHSTLPSDVASPQPQCKAQGGTIAASSTKHQRPITQYDDILAPLSAEENGHVSETDYFYHDKSVTAILHERKSGRLGDFPSSTPKDAANKRSFDFSLKNSCEKKSQRPADSSSGAANAETSKTSRKSQATGNLWADMLKGQEVTVTSPEVETSPRQSTSEKKNSEVKDVSWETELAMYIAARSKMADLSREEAEEESDEKTKVTVSRPISRAKRRLNKEGKALSSGDVAGNQGKASVGAVNADNKTSRGEEENELYGTLQQTKTASVPFSPPVKTLSPVTNPFCLKSADPHRKVGHGAEESTVGDRSVEQKVSSQVLLSEPATQGLSVPPPRIALRREKRPESNKSSVVDYPSAVEDYQQCLQNNAFPPVMSVQTLVQQTFPAKPASQESVEKGSVQRQQLLVFLNRFRARLGKKEHGTDMLQQEGTQGRDHAAIVGTQVGDNDARIAEDTSEKTSKNTQRLSITKQENIGNQDTDSTESEFISTTTEPRTNQSRVKMPAEKKGHGRPARYRPMAVCGPATAHLFETAAGSPQDMEGECASHRNQNGSELTGSGQTELTSESNTNNATVSMFSEKSTLAEDFCQSFANGDTLPPRRDAASGRSEVRHGVTSTTSSHLGRPLCAHKTSDIGPTRQSKIASAERQSAGTRQTSDRNLATRESKNKEQKTKTTKTRAQPSSKPFTDTSLNQKGVSKEMESAHKEKGAWYHTGAIPKTTTSARAFTQHKDQESTKDSSSSSSSSSSSEEEKEEEEGWMCFQNQYAVDSTARKSRKKGNVRTDGKNGTRGAVQSSAHRQKQEELKEEMLWKGLNMKQMTEEEEDYYLGYHSSPWRYPGKESMQRSEADWSKGFQSYTDRMESCRQYPNDPTVWKENWDKLEAENLKRNSHPSRNRRPRPGMDQTTRRQAKDQTQRPQFPGYGMEGEVEGLSRSYPKDYPPSWSYPGPDSTQRAARRTEHYQANYDWPNTYMPSAHWPTSEPNVDWSRSLHSLSNWEKNHQTYAEWLASHRVDLDGGFQSERFTGDGRVPREQQSFGGLYSHIVGPPESTHAWNHSTNTPPQHTAYGKRQNTSQQDFVFPRNDYNSYAPLYSPPSLPQQQHRDPLLESHYMAGYPNVAYPYSTPQNYVSTGGYVNQGYPYPMPQTWGHPCQGFPYPDLPNTRAHPPPTLSQQIGAFFDPNCQSWFVPNPHFHSQLKEYRKLYKRSLGAYPDNAFHAYGAQCGGDSSVDTDVSYSDDDGGRFERPNTGKNREHSPGGTRSSVRAGWGVEDGCTPQQQAGLAHSMHSYIQRMAKFYAKVADRG